jgi:two-component system response regulator HydG
MSVHIEGETGTGKELFAAALHRLGNRSKKPFVAINCAALNNDLAASELFGHRKGAFTGAVADRMGAFEEADGGTLFLDEIADLRAETQAKLLRVLESRCVRRVGANAESRVDVRVVSASNVGLRKLVEDGKFREDLFQRLCCFEVRVPPLRERTADIVPIAERFLATIPDGVGQVFSDAAKRKLVELPWRGNVRELRNLVERSKIVATSREIGPELIAPSSTSSPRREMRRFREIEVDCLRSAIDRCHGNIRATALLLDLSYSTVRSKLIRFGLDDYARAKRIEFSKALNFSRTAEFHNLDDVKGE